MAAQVGTRNEAPPTIRLFARAGHGFLPQELSPLLRCGERGWPIDSATLSRQPAFETAASPTGQRSTYHPLGQCVSLRGQGTAHFASRALLGPYPKG
jgi:hypothetical protein